MNLNIIETPKTATTKESTISRKVDSDSNTEIRSVSAKAFLAFVTEHFTTGLEGKRIAIWGASDDITDMQSTTQVMRLAKRLAKLGAIVVCHCGFEDSFKTFGGQIEIVADKQEAINNSDALLVLTSSQQYVGYSSDPGSLNEVLIFDLWGSLIEESLTNGSAVYYNVTEQMAHKSSTLCEVAA